MKKSCDSCDGCDRFVQQRKMLLCAALCSSADFTTNKLFTGRRFVCVIPDIYKTTVQVISSIIPLAISRAAHTYSSSYICKEVC